MHLRFDISAYRIVKDKESGRFFAVLKSETPQGISNIDPDQEVNCVSISRSGDLEIGFTKSIKRKNLDDDLWIEDRG